MTLASPLATRVLSGDRRALARAISAVEDRLPGAAELMATVYRRAGRAHLTGITGPPGVGKSTLVHALISGHRGRGMTVGALCIDPSSTISQGALLGDRVRMGGFHEDEGVYIRSMATRGTLGGLARAAGAAVILMDAADLDEVLVETVGVGQSELNIRNAVDLVVLVLMPGSGDSVQLLKAGVMEIPDIIVVNKRDRAGAAELAADLRRTPPSGAGGAAPRPRIILTDALSGDGVAELGDAISEVRGHRTEQGGVGAQRADTAAAVLELALEQVREQLAGIVEDGQAAALLDAVSARRTDPGSAAHALLEQCFGPDGARMATAS
jgi:LAO/AO transport system kinase